MPYSPISSFVSPLSNKPFGYERHTDFRREVTFYDRVRFVGSDSTLEIFGGTMKGDLFSAQWNGAIPANLATVDGAATAGFYLDSSAGAAQFEGDVWVGGRIEMQGGTFSTDASATEPRIDITSAGSWNATIQLFPNTTYDRAIIGASDAVPIFLDDAKYLWFANDSNTSVLYVGPSADLQITAAEITLQGNLRTSATNGAMWIPVAVGTEALPQYSFVNDTDTGMYRETSNQIAWSTTATKRMSLNANGLEIETGLGINTAQAASPRLKVLANSGDEAFRFKRNTATAGARLGTLRSNVGGTDTDVAVVQSDGDWFNINGTYGTISDERLKTNMRPVRSYWDDFRQVAIIKYEMNGQSLIGVGAQTLQPVFPSLVKEAEDGTLTVKSSILFGPILGRVVHELQERVEALEEVAQVNRLTKQVNSGTLDTTKGDTK